MSHCIILALLLFAPFSGTWAGAPFVHFLDRQRQVGVQIQYDAEQRRIQTNLIQINPTALTPLAKSSLEKGLSIHPPLISSTEPTPIEIRLFDVPIARYILDPRSHTFSKNTQFPARLTPFELRQFGRRGTAFVEEWKKSRNNPEVKRLSPEIRPRADLHTHFSGAVRAQVLLDVSEELKIPYPTHLLDQVGIPYQREAVLTFNGLPHVPLTRENLGDSGLERLRREFSIDLSQVENFTKMELIYTLRSPITKNPTAFARLLSELAKDYQTTGINYVELSASEILTPEMLEEAHRILPQIEKETGVKIRFLASLWRHNDPVLLGDQIAKIKALKASPYIVGVDFMGHETNSTRDFTPLIRELAEYRERENPNFAIRVHAGENPLHPENVREAILAGATRIGHGLYGMDDETLKLAQEKGVIVEFNLNSNLALNNIFGSQEVPIRHYLDAGVRVTLGTDGHGLYQTDHLSEITAAQISGLTEEDLKKIRASDSEYIQRMEKVFKQKLRTPGSLRVPKSFPNLKFTPEFYRQLQEKRKARVNAWATALQERGVQQVTLDNLPLELKRLTPVLFSGASVNSWPLISPHHHAEIRKAIQQSLATLDPSKALIVTAGEDYGIEAIVHEEARQRGFKILGTLVENGDIPALASVTHATLCARSWYEKSAVVLNFIKKADGTAIFIGGRGVTRDEIQAARNVGVPFHLMKGPEGAANDATQLFPDEAFETPEQLRSRLSCIRSKIRGQ